MQILMISDVFLKCDDIISGPYQPWIARPSKLHRIDTYVGRWAF